MRMMPMFTRLNKAMEQMAQAKNDFNSDRIVLESHAQKVRRLEELIRAKETTGDRIVIGLAAALVVFSMALPAYAAFYSNGYAYVPSISIPIAVRSGLASKKFQISAHPLMDTSRKKENTSELLRNEKKSI